MKRPAYVFRPSATKEPHMKAWDILTNYTAGKKSDFIASAILAYSKADTAENDEHFKNLIRQVISEELQKVAEFKKPVESKSDVITTINIESINESKISRNEKAPSVMLDFFSGLM